MKTYHAYIGTALGMSMIISTSSRAAEARTGWCESAPVVVANVDPNIPPPTRNIFTILPDYCVALHQSHAGATASQGASFSYKKQTGGTDTFQSNFALTFTPNLTPFALGSYTGDLFIYSSVDGNVSTRSNAKNTFINIRPQLGALLHSDVTNINAPSNPAADWFWITRFGPVFEGSQDFKVQNVLGEFNVGLRHDNWAMGAYTPVAGSGSLFFTWLPFLDIEAGTNVKGRITTNEISKTRLRVMPQLGFSFSYSGVGAKFVGAQSLALSIDDTVAFLPLEGGTRSINGKGVRSDSSHNFFSADFDINFTDNVSLGFTFSSGATAPFFKQANTFLASFKVGFGTPVPGLLSSPQAAANP